MRHSVYKAIARILLLAGEVLVAVYPLRNCSTSCVSQSAMQRRFHRARDHVPLCTSSTASGLSAL